MAVRPIFIPDPTVLPGYVRIEEITFTWHPGFSKTQAQKSIVSLHEAVAGTKSAPVLEISSKSLQKLGVALSAFNLQVQVEGLPSMSVECAFQGSKIFQNGGPYTDLYALSSREAKKDERLRTSGDLTSFLLKDLSFPTTPTTAFYDWLYLRALVQNRDLADQLSNFGSFSDIAFNPHRSFACQARSAALYVSLVSIKDAVDMDRLTTERDYYLTIISAHPVLGPLSKHIMTDYNTGTYKQLSFNLDG